METTTRLLLDPRTGQVGTGGLWQSSQTALQAEAHTCSHQPMTQLLPLRAMAALHHRACSFRSLQGPCPNPCNPCPYPALPNPQVVWHEDRWENKPAIVLPMAWRRLNAICQGCVYRLLGWEAVLQAAEARLARSSWDEG